MEERARKALAAGWRLRAADARDNPVITGIIHRATHATYDFMPWTHSLEETEGFVARALDDRWRSVWLAVRGDQAAGVICLEEGFVDQLFVDPGQDGQGIGSLLLERAAALYPGGLRLFTFQKNARARAFYESHGFEAVRFGLSPEELEPDVEYMRGPHAPVSCG